MIRLNHDAALSDWYTALLVPYIQSRDMGDPPASPEAAAVYARLKSLTDQEIRDILLLPPEKLTELWVIEYVDLCRVFAEYAALYKKRPKGDRERQKELRREFIAAHGGLPAFAGVFSFVPDAARSWDRMDETMEKLADLRNEINEVVERKFSYRFLDELNLRGELVERMNVPICPYCNKQYIQAVRSGTERHYMGDLDHLLPQSVYRLFSLSLWNLVPSCKSCNQTFKKAKNENFLNPHLEGFGRDCILTLHYQTVGELIGRDLVQEMRWEIQPSAGPELRERIETNLRVFQLDASYDYHRRDIRLALRRRYAARSKSASLRRLGQELQDPLLLYGVSLDPDRFREEFLSKAIYDALCEN